MADTNVNILIYNIMRKLVFWRPGVYSSLLTFRSKLKFLYPNNESANQKSEITSTLHRPPFSLQLSALQGCFGHKGMPYR